MADPILVVEISNSDIQWAEPRDVTVQNLESTSGLNFIELTHSHGGAIRYITLRGKLGVLPAATSATAVAQLASISGRFELQAEAQP